ANSVSNRKVSSTDAACRARERRATVNHSTIVTAATAIGRTSAAALHAGTNSGSGSKAREIIPTSDAFIGNHGHETDDTAWIQAAYWRVPKTSAPTRNVSTIVAIAEASPRQRRVAARYRMKMAQNALTLVRRPRYTPARSH